MESWNLSPWHREAASLLRLAIPLVVGQLSAVAMGFTDTVMAGWLSAQTVAAVALGSALWGMPLLLLVGTLSGLAPLVAQLVGAQRVRDVAPLTLQAGWIGVALTVPVVAFLVQSSLVLSRFSVDPEVLPVAAAYLRALAWGVPGFVLYLVLRYMSEGLAHTRPVLYVGLLGLGVNVIGNWVLMYGKLGFPALGAVGCGYSTAVVFWIQGLAMAAYVARAPVFRAVRPLVRPPPLAWRPLGELLWVGLPVGVALLIQAGMFTIVALLMASFGTVAIAAHQVALNFVSLLFMVPLSLSMATAVRVGQAAGRNDGGAVRRAGWTGIALALAIQAALGVVLVSAPRAIARIYTDDPEVIALAVRLLIVGAVFHVFNGGQVSASGALRGLKDTRGPMVITAVAYWLIGLPVGYTLGLHLGAGPVGLWYGFVGGFTTAAALLFWRFHRASARGASMAVCPAGPLAAK